MGVTKSRRRRSTGVRVALATRQTETDGESWERFEVLYRSSRDDIYAYVLTLLRDRAAAEDATALAFERAYRRRRTFDRRRGDERGWLFGIARNAALDELRRRRRTATLVVDPQDITDDEPAASGDEDQLVRRAAVREALATLAPRERELIALKFHAGLTNAELAAVLGVSESNAGTMLHRAVQKLRRAVNAPV
ncbi:MAG: sigma-70 family RNA polymerase sigma factor [Acidobacteriota bacterium]|nr:sigma-70 family RNA polymerase sigma factor [Acidobacteriota bacterium]